MCKVCELCAGARVSKLQVWLQTVQTVQYVQVAFGLVSEAAALQVQPTVVVDPEAEQEPRKCKIGGPTSVTGSTCQAQFATTLGTFPALRGALGKSITESQKRQPSGYCLQQLEKAWGNTVTLASRATIFAKWVVSCPMEQGPDLSRPELCDLRKRPIRASSSPTVAQLEGKGGEEFGRLCCDGGASFPARESPGSLLDFFFCIPRRKHRRPAEPWVSADLADLAAGSQ